MSVSVEEKPRVADIYQFELTDIKGQPRQMSEFQGKVLLIVNTASKCGLTPQFKGLQDLYERYHEQGLEVLGFPCNQFLSQDPGSNAEIAEFCQSNYGVTFPMFARIEVNGNDAHPLYRFLKKARKGALGIEAIKWNFSKFLVSRKGEVLERYAPTDEPETIAEAIERALG